MKADLVCTTLIVTLATCLGSREGSRSAYDEFRQRYGRSSSGQADEVSYAERRALFDDRKAAVNQHNAQPGISWEAAVNHLADYTEAEFNAMLGYRVSSWRNTQSGASSSFLETRPIRALAETVDWRSKSNRSSKFMRNQGACGSCWAVAAVGALEMHAELLSGPTEQLSFEQLVDCVPNPKHCGGEGGCKGATAELAFQYVKEHGLVAADKYKGYMSTGKEGECKPPGKESTAIDGFAQLPVNKLRDLMESLHDHGPVVVSVDAGGWSSYSKGVFDGCPKDATVNHAVLTVGYGKDKQSGKDYWLIRNSWGSTYGEEGHIRVQRHSSDEGEDGYCGTDYKPKDGVGCDGGPKTLPVCGMCGILSDSSYPKGVRIVSK